MEESIFLTVVEVCRKFPEGFTKEQIESDPRISKNPRFVHWVRVYFVSINKENSLYGQMFIPVEDNTYMLSANAEQAFIDYQELREARESAKKAQAQGNLAVEIAIASLVASVLVGILQI